MSSRDAPAAFGVTAVLRAAMAGRAEPFDPIALAGGRAIDRGPGLIELVPDRSAAAASVLSAGIHGNETAPLELLLALADALDAARLQVGTPMLLVIGHPAAIVAGTRYVDTNLNRLFTREPAASGTSGQEYARAEVLMDTVDAFWEQHGGPVSALDQAATPLHLDLHTAIRASRYPRFVVEPFADLATPQPVWRAIAGAGLQAVLSQHAPSPTFSHYSRAQHGVAAFTLELGRVAAFGDNDLAALRPMADWLAARVEGRPAHEADPNGLAFFRVASELRRVSDDFELGFAEDVANFTPFAVGTMIARDGEAGETVVAEAPVYVVFPNARVERGARAALLARPVAAPALTSA